MPKKDYEYVTEKVDRYDYLTYIEELHYFGWEQKGIFKYRDGNYRVTKRRDFDDPRYRVWVYNESLFKYLQSLSVNLEYMQRKLKDLKVTFDELAEEPEYELKGIRKFLQLRSKEQKEEIKSKVEEINRGYESFKSILKEDVEYINSLADKKYFFGKIGEDGSNFFPHKEQIDEIKDKYLFKPNPDGGLHSYIHAIEYSFTEKAVVLTSDSYDDSDTPLQKYIRARNSD